MPKCGTRSEIERKEDPNYHAMDAIGTTTLSEGINTWEFSGGWLWWWITKESSQQTIVRNHNNTTCGRRWLDGRAAAAAAVCVGGWVGLGYCCLWPRLLYYYIVLNCGSQTTNKENMLQILFANGVARNFLGSKTVQWIVRNQFIETIIICTSSNLIGMLSKRAAEVLLHGV